VPAVHTGRDI